MAELVDIDGFVAEEAHAYREDPLSTSKSLRPSHNGQ
jgi:hypothetical protein